MLSVSTTYKPAAGYGNIYDIPRTRPRGESGEDTRLISLISPLRRDWDWDLVVKSGAVSCGLDTGDPPENVNIPPLIFLNPHFDLLIWVQTRLILDPGLNTRRGNVKCPTCLDQNFLSFISRSFLSYDNLHNRHVYVWIICNLCREPP